jgi:hypothetical protein
MYSKAIGYQLILESEENIEELHKGFKKWDNVFLLNFRSYSKKSLVSAS